MIVCRIVVFSSHGFLAESLHDLPHELREEMARLDEVFCVDRQKLKSITNRFQEELEDGTQSMSPFSQLPGRVSTGQLRAVPDRCSHLLLRSIG